MPCRKLCAYSIAFCRSPLAASRPTHTHSRAPLTSRYDLVRVRVRVRDRVRVSVRVRVRVRVRVGVRVRVRVGVRVG